MRTGVNQHALSIMRCYGRGLAKSGNDLRFSRFAALELLNLLVADHDAMRSTACCGKGDGNSEKFFHVKSLAIERWLAF